MSPSTGGSQTATSSDERMPTAGLAAPGSWTATLRAEELPASATYVDMASRELEVVLTYWGYKPETWRLMGFTPAVPGELYPLSDRVHPIVEIAQSLTVVRRQSLGLAERDAADRHQLMQYLASRGLPVPTLVRRPDDSTYAVVPVVPLTDPELPKGNTYVIEQALYEIQAFVSGRRYVTDGPMEDVYLEAAARTLADLHLTSETYPGPRHHWPRERTARAIAEAYLKRIADAGKGAGGMPRPVAAGLRRVARDGATWIARAAANLDAHPSLPAFHIHGDYQPHNLAFIGDHVSAIYDFETAHWDRRILDLAYAVLAFTGLRWDGETPSGTPEPTPPLVEHGLDLDRARAFLSAYGKVAPPHHGEANLLGDALLMVLPILFANAVAEDLIFVDRYPHPAHSARECRAHVAWAETFPQWIAEHHAALAEAWQQGATHA